MDNLESQTYETFEKDPVKYKEYESAVHQALTLTPEEKVTVLMVVGAGRGPLIEASLRAAVTARRQLRVYAVEKNPNAVVTLRNMHRDLGWEGRVTIVASDMRVWEAPEKASVRPARPARTTTSEQTQLSVAVRVMARPSDRLRHTVFCTPQADILVSELLGSFSDNELSPECLDGAQKFLRRDGISIPSE